MAWLEANRTMVISDYHRAFVEAFGREDVSAANLHALRKRNGWKTGRTGHFVRGGEPHNKGKPFNPPGSEKGRFKKGNLPHNHRGAGHERVDSKDGYVFLIIDETNPHTGADTRPVLKHKYLWEKANGPVPEGHRLKCLDGDKTNCDPSNWEAIPMALAPRLNGRFGRGYDDAPAELKHTIMATAKLEHALREKKKAKV
ncbi:HNH endonuclease [Pseudooceanicola nanhaiensis]|uniref:HNH endonuclease n=1 Tax=Pseudooceanicola nanhaiensis TaxID=375761 RepID=UPI001CD81ABD|nr:HNH endonuclease [Pseudooceanicola nanhaiensis]MCA0922198.1 HNH endonuclease [Pseudooceanicola nanhaiensis]